MNPARFALIVGLILATSRIAGAQDVPAADFVIIPLRVHVLRSAEIDQANCRLTDAEVARVAGNINAIWHKAGIHFGVESILCEPAAQQERFRVTAAASGGEIGAGSLWMLLPRASRAFDGVHVYYFHELPFNSAYMGDEVVFSNEGAQVHEVPGAVSIAQPVRGTKPLQILVDGEAQMYLGFLWTIATAATHIETAT